MFYVYSASTSETKHIEKWRMKEELELKCVGSAKIMYMCIVYICICIKPEYIDLFKKDFPY